MTDLDYETVRYLVRRDGNLRGRDALALAADRDRAEAELKALRERVEALPRYDQPPCCGSSISGCGPMEPSADGDYFDADDVLAALEPVKP